MVEEIPIAPDYRAIDPSEIAVYPIAPVTTMGDERPTVRLEHSDVTLTFPKRESGFEISTTVEVEFVPDELTVEEESVRRYLETYANAYITPEGMQRMARRHMSEALDIDDVFVQVSTEAKNVYAGAPQ